MCAKKLEKTLPNNIPLTEYEFGPHKYGCDVVLLPAIKAIPNPASVDVETDEIDKEVMIGVGDNRLSFCYLPSELPKNMFKGIKLIGQGFKFDLHMMNKWGYIFNIQDAFFDTQLASYVINPNADSHHLKDNAKNILGITYPTYKEMVHPFSKNKKITLDKQPIERVANYNAMDVICQYRLYQYFDKVFTTNQRMIFNDIEMPTMRLLYEMEEQGCMIDIEHLLGLQGQFLSCLRDYEKEIYSICGKKFNLDSNEQLGETLVSLGFPLPKTKKDNWKVDKPTLEQFGDDYLLDLIKKRNEVQTLLSTFVGGLLERNQDGVIHCDFNQNTDTTRLSCRHPNLQNIPVKTELGKLLRKAFIARPGHKLLCADYNLFEIRLQAHFSQDALFMKSLSEGRDIHQDTADAIGTDRAIGKNYNFACVTIDTPILKANMEWIPAGNLEVGDKLWAFEENNKPIEGRLGARHWIESEVLNKEIKEVECCRISLSNGDFLDCTWDHPLITKTHHKKSIWIQAKDLKIGMFIPKYLDDPKKQFVNEYKAGWLGGFADGEGWTRNAIVGISQNIGPTLERCKQYLTDLGFKWQETLGGNTPSHHVYIRGGHHETLRFFSLTKPMRLIEKYKKQIHMLGAIELPKVVKVESIGKKLISSLTTSSKTYLTKGYGSHNTSYGAMEKKLARQNNISIDVAKRNLDKFWEAHKGLKRWLDEQKQFAHQYGYIETLLQHQIPLPGINSKDKPTRWHWERKAGNTPIQGSAAEITKKAMLALRSAGVIPLIQIHDELLLEVKESDVEEVKELLKTTMENIVDLRIPLKVDVGVGDNWLEAKSNAK